MRRIIDNLGSAFWFAMDIAWMMNYDYLAMILIFPTILSGVLMFWQHKRNVSDVLINLATLSWMLMNITWMISDYIPFWYDVFQIIKIIFAVIGFIAVIILAVIDFKHLGNFRRFRN